MYIETKLHAVVSIDSLKQMIDGTYTMKLYSQGYSSGEISVGILEYKGDHYIVWDDDEADCFGRKLESFNKWDGKKPHPEVREEVEKFLNELLSDYDYVPEDPWEGRSFKEEILDSWCFGIKEDYEIELEAFCDRIKSI